jgi:cytochrome c oxidase cbb3-type subunit IV
MQLISNFLESVDGIEVWFVLSLVIFFSAFVIFLIRIMKRPRKEMEMIKNSILDDDNENNINA